MTFAIVFTVLLVISIFPLYFTGMARMIPAGVRILPFIAIAILWIHTILFRLPGKTGAAGVILLVLFYFIAIVLVFIPALGTVVIGIMDRPQDIQSASFGDQSSPRKTVIVYHPGASSFMPDVIQHLAESLAASGFYVTLYSAHPRVSVSVPEGAVLGLASPVYAGTIRPPLEEFIKKSDLRDRNCFVLLTGSDPDNIEKDTAKAASLVEERGGKVLESVKIIQKKDRETVYPQIEQFVKKLTEEL